jgi:hypothetical protein
LSAYEAYRDSLGASNAETQEAVKLVSDIYQALGDSGRASEWRAKLSDAGVPSK